MIATESYQISYDCLIPVAIACIGSLLSLRMYSDYTHTSAISVLYGEASVNADVRVQLLSSLNVAVFANLGLAVFVDTLYVCQ